jgi:hypothetical protein
MKRRGLTRVGADALEAGWLLNNVRCGAPLKANVSGTRVGFWNEAAVWKKVRSGLSDLLLTEPPSSAPPNEPLQPRSGAEVPKGFKEPLNAARG